MKRNRVLTITCLLIFSLSLSAARKKRKNKLVLKATTEKKEQPKNLFNIPHDVWAHHIIPYIGTPKDIRSLMLSCKDFSQEVEGFLELFFAPNFKKRNDIKSSVFMLLNASSKTKKAFKKNPFLLNLES